MSQQNQQFYEFQWRALNLCSEFYNAAEELVVRNVMCLLLLRLPELACCLRRKRRPPWSLRSVTRWVRLPRLTLS